MRILGIVGSLRAGSSNAAILRAAAQLAPAGVTIDLYEGLGGLPHFNPDLDGEGAVPPPPVATLRERAAAAGAILVCSPEYAHGVPGSLKNALDWLVSTADLIEKRVGVVTAGPGGGALANAQLVETLRTMSWTVVEGACLRLSLSRASFDAHGDIIDKGVLDSLRDAVAALTDGQ